MVVEGIKLNFFNEREYNCALAVLDELYPNGDIDANVVKDKYIGEYREININESMTPGALKDMLQQIEKSYLEL